MELKKYLLIQWNRTIYNHFFILIFMSSCTMAPTQMYENTQILTQDLSSTSLRWTENTLLIDARPFFDYSLHHHPGAISMHWEDFVLKTEDQALPLGMVLEKDLFYHTRRLARYGIGVDTPIIVLGRGLQGNGEEGRLAWTLKYLGIKDVQFCHVSTLQLPRTYVESKPRNPVPIWKPILQSQIYVDKKAVIEELNSISKTLTSSPTPTPHKNGSIPVLLDVSTISRKDIHKEFQNLISGLNPRLSKEDDSVKNLLWTEFLDTRGLKNIEVLEKLNKMGLTKDRPIYVLDTEGVRSATVTLILHEFGFKLAKNVMSEN